MIIHILINIPQTTRRHNTNGSKRNTRKIHILIALRIRDLARPDHNVIRRVIARDAGDRHQLLEQTRARQGDRIGDVCDVSDAEFELHGAADVFLGVGDELGDEDVVVGGVADAAADDADAEGEGRDGGD